MPRNLKRPEQPVDPYKLQSLPTDRPAAVYYRQSSESQIGNISTTIQTVDMIEHLMQRGWVRENILMIDMDAAVSGQKKIRERKGMSQLYDLVVNGVIGLVATQDVDRLFRDGTMIESNTFIEACKCSNVQIMTPKMVYDFNHPIMGPSHVKFFREEAERAADYIHYQIRGKLVASRHRRSAVGMWSGRKILPGFMVDCRTHLPDKTLNPDFRKYKRFDLYADVVQRYFEIFREFNGNLFQTWQHIERHGPYFPDLTADSVPEGFKATQHIDRRSDYTGGLTPSKSGFQQMLINVAYIGHWVHKGAIVQFNNHEPLIALDLFMYAYNRISNTDFHGDTNLFHVPYRPWIRHKPEERAGQQPGTYEEFVYSDDLSEHPHKRVACIWNTDARKYQYQLAQNPDRSCIWNIKTFIVDPLIDEMLLERLQATTIDEVSWQAALASLEHVDQAEMRRVRNAIRQHEQTKENLVASLGTVTHPEMVQRAQARYEQCDREIALLQTQLEQIKSGKQQSHNLKEAREVLTLVIQRWQDVPREEKRALFEAFGLYINISKITRTVKRITIYWRDGTTSERNSSQFGRSYFWEPEELQRLKEMVEAHVDQVEILRAFPDYNWRALQERYCYNFGKWRYKGKRVVKREMSWQDIKHQYTEIAGLSQLPASSTSIGKSGCVCCCIGESGCVRWYIG